MIGRMKQIHGGDVYRNKIKTDFSVNINPFGIPGAVEDALYTAVDSCTKYPDITVEKLKKAVKDMLDVPEEYLLFGNGASELFMAIVHGIKPKKTVIPVPSFYGYEHAAHAVDGELIFYKTKAENGFCLGEDLFDILTEDIDMLFLANPNNPTGNLISMECLKNILVHCRVKGIYVVLDECFIEFCGKECSILKEIDQFDNLIVVRAFTKIFSIPGVRLGYLVCSNQLFLERIKRQLPEWNISTFAQAAGCVCATQTAFISKTVDFIKKERQFLEEGLKQLGFQVFSSEANFILFHSEKPLYDRLLEHGILIRDCKNFRGLSKGFFRIAVKERNENENLLKRMGEIN